MGRRRLLEKRRRFHEGMADVSFCVCACTYEGWDINSGNYLFITDTK